MGSLRAPSRLALLARTSLALAQPKPPTQQQMQQAGDLVKKAIAKSQAGDHALAIELYQQAYTIVPQPLLLSNIGSSTSRRKKPVEALKYFCKYLEADPTGANVDVRDDAGQGAADRARQHDVDDKDVCAAQAEGRAAATAAASRPSRRRSGTERRSGRADRRRRRAPIRAARIEYAGARVAVAGAVALGARHRLRRASAPQQGDQRHDLEPSDGRRRRGRSTSSRLESDGHAATRRIRRSRSWSRGGVAARRRRRRLACSAASHASSRRARSSMPTGRAPHDGRLRASAAGF